MSKIDLKVPNIGDFKDVEVIEVLIKEGENINKNDPLITIESDKSSVEIPSTENGKILKLFIKVVDKVSEGDKILEIETFLATKNEENKKILQEIYDFNFRQLELSIREIGYGDQSINKKMKDYINLFHSMVSEMHFWDHLSKSDKIEKLSIFLEDFNNIDDLLDYFDEFNLNLSKKTLNYYLKSVSNP